MKHLTRHDYATALALLACLEQHVASAAELAAATVEMVRGFVPAESVRLMPGEAVAGMPHHLATLPLAMSAGTPVSIVLERRHAHFSERERERLALLQPHLAFLFRQAAGALPSLPSSGTAAAPQARDLASASSAALTPREGDVMHWLACGKTDADIAALLAISPRTVHKHLEHIYEKLGVETRTAAVMAVRRHKPDSTPGLAWTGPPGRPWRG